MKPTVLKTVSLIGCFSLVFSVLATSYVPHVDAAKQLNKKNEQFGALLSDVTEQRKFEKIEDISIIQVAHVTKKRIVTFSQKLTEVQILEYETTYSLKFERQGKSKNRYIVLPQNDATFERFITEVKPQAVHNNDEYTVKAQTTDWGIAKMNVPAAWNASPSETGDSVVVAVIDSGVDATHPDLAGAVLPGGYDYFNMDADPTDDNGHGTHVAGMIAAVNNTDGTVGAAYDAKILPFKVCNSAGLCDSLAITDAIEAATAANVEVINMSLGGSANALIQQAINEATAAGVIVVASAGNEGAGHCLYPGAYSNVVCVGAITDTDTKPSFGNYGPELDIVTPGVAIRSLALGGGTVELSGTSMSAAYYSGAAALVASSIKEYCVATPADPACSDIRTYTQTLLQTVGARDLGTAGRDDTFGYGAVDLSAIWSDIEIQFTNVIAMPERGANYTQNLTITNNSSDDITLTTCTIQSKNQTRVQTIPSLGVTTLNQGTTPYTSPVSNGPYSTFTFGTPITLSSTTNLPFSYTFTPSTESMPYDVVSYDFSCQYDIVSTVEVEAYSTKSEDKSFTIDWPLTLKRLYFTFGRLKYNQAFYSSQLRSWDTLYLVNYHPSKIQFKYMFLYDYSLGRNQGYTRYWKTWNSMGVRTNYYLPRYRKYAYVAVFRDVAIGLEIKKYFVFYTR